MATEEEARDDGQGDGDDADEDNLNLNCDSDSSEEEKETARKQAELEKKQRRKVGGLDRYHSDSKKFDMNDIDNHFRFLQHIDTIKNPEES